MRYFDGLGNNVTAYVLGLEAKVKELETELKLANKSAKKLKKKVSD